MQRDQDRMMWYRLDQERGGIVTGLVGKAG